MALALSTLAAVFVYTFTLSKPLGLGLLFGGLVLLFISNHPNKHISHEDVERVYGRQPPLDPEILTVAFFVTVIYLFLFAKLLP